MTGGRVNKFNIAKQTKDYDPQGAYIKAWVPELKAGGSLRASTRPTVTILLLLCRVLLRTSARPTMNVLHVLRASV
jgi:hypothetical protein